MELRFKRSQREQARVNYIEAVHVHIPTIVHSGFGKFNAEADPKDLDIPRLVDQAKQIAHGLWNFSF
jgi:hypothetical protein